jgi:hypothetical protein
MSNVQSTDLQSLNEIITNVCVSVTTSTSVTQTANCYAANTMSFKGIDIDCDNITARQGIGNICTLNASTREDNSANLSNEIANKLITALNSEQTSVQSFLAAASNVQVNKQDIQNIIKTTVNNSIRADTFNECALSVYNSNTMNWDFAKVRCRPGGNFVLDQSVMNNAVGNCLSEKVTAALLENRQLNDIVSEMTSKQASEQKGIAELVGAWGMIIIGIVFFIVVIIVGVLVYLNYNPEVAKELTGKIPAGGPGAAFM